VWHDSFICVTRLIHMCDTTHSYAWHDSFIFVTWLIHMCDTTYSYVWHVSFIRVTEPEFRKDDRPSSCHSSYDSFTYVTRRIHMCDMTHSYVRHNYDSGMTADQVAAYNNREETRDFLRRLMVFLIHICDMTHSYVWHDPLRLNCLQRPEETRDFFCGVSWYNSLICVTWLISICDMTHSYVGRDVSLYVTRLTPICSMTHTNVAVYNDC